MATRPRLRQILDLVVTLAMGIAAVLIIWRGTTMSPQAAATSPPVKPAIEDISRNDFTTTFDPVFARGDANARIVLIEFSDFECPFCRKYYKETFAQVDDELVATGKIRYAFRHFPLEKVHVNAIAAARAAECASQQGKFWEMRAQLFERQPEIGRAFWVPGSKQIGLQPQVFEDCLQKTGEDERIRGDQEEAIRLGVKVTPTFLVGVAEGDGVRLLRKIEGAHSFSVFNEAVGALATSAGK